MKKTATAILLLLLLILPLNSGADDSERLIGKATVEQVLEHDPEYRDRMIVYSPDPEAVAAIASCETETLIKLFYRNDCPDSVREVPRLLKTLKVAGNPLITLEIIGVNYGKDEPADLLKGWEIEYVPTVIVIQAGVEKGRIVEEALVSMETDLATILIE